MTDKKEIQCEYCTVRSNENKCKALEIEFHNCLNILEKKKCPIYKLKQQLQTKERELEPFKDDYFKNLDTKVIAKLAKKSIRLTTENRKLEAILNLYEDSSRSLSKSVLKLIEKVEGSGENGDT